MGHRALVVSVSMLGLLLVVLLSGSPDVAAAEVKSVEGPYVDKLVYRIIESDDQTVLSLINDEIDIIGDYVDTGYLDILSTSPDVTVSATLRNGYGRLVINTAKYPLNITEFRRAISFAIDKLAIANEVWGGWAEPLDSCVPKVNPLSIEGQLPYTYYEANVDLGNYMLDTAGFIDIDGDYVREAPDGSEFSVTIECASSSSIAIATGQYAVDALNALQVQAFLQPTDFYEYLQRLYYHGDFDIAFLGASFSDFDLDWLAYEYWGEYADEPYWNFPMWRNATYDSWRDQLLHSVDYEDVREAAIEMQRIWVEACPEIICYENMLLSAYRTDVFENQVNSVLEGVPGWWTNYLVRLQDSQGGPFGGTWRSSLPLDVDTFNFMITSSAYSNEVNQMLWDTLLRQDESGRDILWLAESVVTETYATNPSVPEGRTRFTFQIHENVTWTDGEPLTAEDVVYSLNYYRDSSGNPLGVDLTEMVSAYTTGTYIAVVEFSTESYWHLHAICYKPIIPEHVFVDIGLDGWNTWDPNPPSESMVTSGPFIVTDRVVGEFIELSVNPDYFLLPNRTIEPENQPPVIVPAPDLAYANGSLGNYIVWSASDTDPLQYAVHEDGTFLLLEPWNGSDITVNVDGLDVGDHVYELTIYDTANQISYDSVIVTVYSTDVPPQILGYDDIVFEYGSLGYTVYWYVTDYGPFVYEVYCDGLLVDYGNGSAPGVAVEVSLDGLELGSYEYVLVATGQGGQSQDNVLVDVITASTTHVTGPDDFTMDVGELGQSITWYLQSQYPAAYEVYWNGELLLMSSWTQMNETVSISLDGIMEGEHDFFILAIGWDGNATDTVHVTVVASHPSPYVSSPDDVVFLEGATGYSLFWDMYDDHPSYYVIYFDGIDYQWDYWTEAYMGVEVSLDWVPAGVHEFCIVASNQWGLNTTDCVTVTVVPSSGPPLIVGPDDIIIEEGSMGYSVWWELHCASPLAYEVYLDGMIILSENWTDMMAQVSVSLDGLSTGTYTYEIVAIGTEGSSSDVVIVTVVPYATYPSVYGDTPVTMTEGELGRYVMWMIWGEYPDYYVVYLDGQEVVRDGWVNGQNVTISLDGFGAGYYDFFIDVTNQLGYTATGYVQVIVNAAEGPPVIDSPGDTTIYQGDGELFWNIFSASPFEYQLYRDGNLVESGYTYENAIGVSHWVGGLPVGTYIYEMVATNDYGTTWNALILTVMPNPAIPWIEGLAWVTVCVDENASITWTIHGQYPDYYVIYLWMEEIERGSWVDGQNVTLFFQASTTGFWVYEIVAVSLSGAETWFSTAINVVSPYPMVWGPDDIVMNFGDTGLYIGWQICDPQPLHYEVWQDGEMILWETWWESNVTVRVSLDGLLPGEHSFSIQAIGRDAQAFDDVVVLVLSDFSAPVIYGPDYYSFTEGETGHSLTFMLYDEYPYSYGYRIDEQGYVGFAWDSPNATLTIPLDDLGPGGHRVTVYARNQWGMYTLANAIVEVVPQEGYIPHGPILIYGDWEMEYMGALEGWLGNGSLAAPFVIENYWIQDGCPCIHIESVTLHFVIRNCLFTVSADQTLVGIELNSVTTGRVENCRFENAFDGVDAYFSSGFEVVSCYFDCPRGQSAIYLLGCYEFLVAGNEMVGEYAGIRMSECITGTVEQNYVRYSTGILLEQCTECIIANNTLVDGGMMVDGYSGVYWDHIVTGNTLNGRPVGYFTEWNETDIVSTAYEKDIDASPYGQLFVMGCTNARVHGGLFGIGSWGVVAAGCTGCEFSNLTLCNSSAFFLRSCSLSYMSNLEFAGWSTLNMIYCTDLVIQGCRFHGNYYAAMRLYECQQCTIMSCDLTNDHELYEYIGLTVSGIQLSSCYNTQIRASTMSGWMSGVSVISSSGTFITDCQFLDNSEHGLYIGRYTIGSCVTNCLFSNNKFGIFIEWSWECCFVGNSFVDNTLFNAYDYGPDEGANFWDDGVSVGNTWSDYIGYGWYYVAGHGLGIDHYPTGMVPLVPPQVTNPDDICFEEGQGGVMLVWLATDDNPAYYEVYLDGDLYLYSYWTDEIIEVAIDLSWLAPGDYEFVLILYDLTNLTASDSVWVCVAPETVPPETYVSLSGTPGNNGWWVSSVVVSLWANDTISGVAHTEYSFDAVSWLIYDDVFSVDLQGVTTVYYRSVDARGNYEDTKNLTLFIDTVAPTSEITILGPNEGTDPVYVSSSTQFAINAWDATSGAMVTEYSVDAGDWIAYSEPFSLTSAGMHEICFRSLDYAGNCEPEQILTVVVNAVTLTYTGDVNGTYSDPACLSALLVETASGNPVAGREIIFALGLQTTFGTTDANGTAIVYLVITQPAGLVGLSVCFVGDYEYPGCATNASFLVEKELVTLQYTGSTVVTSGSVYVELQATVFEQMDDSLGDLTLVYVTFLLYDGLINSTSPVQVVGSIPVLATEIPGIGVASVWIPNLPAGQYFVLVSLDPSQNMFYDGPLSEAVTLTVADPTHRCISGSGWITDPSGRKAHFTFVVKYGRDGSLKGFLKYTYKDGNHTYEIVSTTITGMAIDGNHAYFEGYCKILEYLHCKHQPVTIMENCRFRVDVWDSRSKCTPDVFQIRVSDELGLVVHEAGVDPLGRVYCGCINIHRVHRMHKR